MDILNQAAAGNAAANGENQTSTETTATNGNEAAKTVEPAVYQVVNEQDCRIITETITFKKTTEKERQQGIDYEILADKDGKPTGEIRRKPETIKLPYALLSNFGITAEYDEAANDYKDKDASLLFSLICTRIYEQARALIATGKGFGLDEVSFKAIAAEDRSTRGGRKAEVDQTLLDKAVESIAKYLTEQGKKKEVVAHHVQVFKTRLRGAASFKTEILRRMHQNLGQWFTQTSDAEREELAPVFVFLDTKFNDALNVGISEGDY